MIAVVADIHGNRWAFQAVMDDIRRRGIQRIVNLGDSLYGPLDPRGTADLLLSMDIPTVRGNEDRILVAADEKGAANRTLRQVRSQLEEKHHRWLEALPLTMRAYQCLFLCHGTPQRDDEYFLRVVTQDGLRSRTPDELLPSLTALEAAVLLCGHDHLPAEVRLSDGHLIVNPGSVGLQAYTDDHPAPHSVAAGTPHARYAVLSSESDRWSVEHIQLPYDWNAAAELAERNGRSDWAAWLRTGQATL